MSVHVEFPDEILLVVRENRDTFVRQAMVYTLGHLYEQGKMSSGFAAQVLGCDRTEVYRLFSDAGFAVIDYPEDEWATEAAAAQMIGMGDPTE